MDQGVKRKGTSLKDMGYAFLVFFFFSFVILHLLNGKKLDLHKLSYVGTSAKLCKLSPVVKN